MRTLWQDLRYAVRMLLKKPAFTAVTVLTLALGIGANTTIFSAINALLLKPYAFRETERLVSVFETLPQIGVSTGSVAPANFLDVRGESASFESIAASSGWSADLTEGERPERIMGAAVTSKFFDVLGVEMQMGRAFAPEEEQPGREPVVVISDELWRRRFNADPGVVERVVRINDRSTTVVGVAPPGATYPRGGVEMWRPFIFEDEDTREREAHYLRVTGRLKAGVTIEGAEAELTAIARRLGERYPETNGGRGLRAMRFIESETRGPRPYLMIMLGAVGFVLLLACANVANLLLLRAAGRSREIAVRLALGASRFRVVRQLLTESALLAIVGGAFGLLLSVWGVEALRAGMPANFAKLVPGWSNLGIDWTVFGFTLLLSLATGVVFGLVPALQASKTNLNESLKEGGRSGGAQGRARNRTRNVLVVSEVALSLVLLVGAGLMMRSFVALMNTDPGFNSANVLTFDVALPRSRYAENVDRANFYQRLIERLTTLPGATGAAAVNNVPLGFNSSDVGFWREDTPAPAPGKAPLAQFGVVTPNYFNMMEIPLLQGRSFDERDVKDSPPVVIVNRKLAQKYFPGEDPVGRRLHLGDEKTFEIKGVVGNVLHEPFTDRLDDGLEPELAVYVPHAQNSWSGMTAIIRTTADPASLTSAAQRELQAIDKDQPMHNVRTMTQIFSESMAPQRLSSFMFAVFALVALVLAAVGIYAVVAFTVAQRTHEIGIRIALGAQRGDIFGLVIGQGMRLIAAGLVVGLLAAFAVTRLMASILIGVSTTDFATFGGISLLLSLIALAACYVPARRATKVDPMVALRYE
ncbi:MAG: ABC transporter permease [Acidobacteriota bacterium]|nr:ABC transporter permease [Acidobacteriota bacterium]